MKKFDVQLGNPPYQKASEKRNEGNGSKGSRNTIWQHFVVKAISLCEDNGYVCLVHPARWRKPEDKTGTILKQKDILYLEIHSKHDGLKTFGAMTNYDWYILKNCPYKGETVLKDQRGIISQIDLRDWSFIPNFDFEKIRKILAKPNENTCEVLYSRSAYGSDKLWMQEKQSEEFQYPCVHSTTQSKVRYWYSKTNKNGFFGIPKIIFGDNGGDTGIYNAIIDVNGVFGLTNHAIGFTIKDEKEGKNVKKAIESESFKEVINSCQYGGFQIDYRIFKYFRKDFWKEFI